MTGPHRDLVASVVDLAERRYGVDWGEIRAAVEQRLQSVRPLPADLMDPWQSPSSWCVPLLVGDYVGADSAAVRADLERYVAGCVYRHLYFETPSRFPAGAVDKLEALVGPAYEACADPGGSFEDRFAAKCESWTVVLAFGTQSIGSTPSGADGYASALSAIVSVYSCTQVLDDWHDREDDEARGHWNMWTDEDAGRTWRVIDPLLRDAARRVGQLRPHALRDALTAQLRDTAAELADLVALAGGPRARRPSSAVESGVAFLADHLGAQVPALWRDFSAPGTSTGSTECISAFIAALLAPVPCARALARSVASTLLAHSRPTGGWGYRQDVVEDVDSTAWVLLATARTGVVAAPGLIDRSQRYLLAHRRAEGGFATYGDAERAQLSTVDLPQWSEPDTTVTCSALLALTATGYRDDDVVRSGCDFVASRWTDGGWTSLWWQGTAYSTWLAVRLLTELGDGRYRGRLDAARVHLLATRHTDGGWGEGESSNAFDTALAIQTLRLLARPGDVALVDDSASALAGWRDETGSWRGGARMLAPGVDPDGPLVLRDDLVTTACVVATLAQS